MDRVVERPSQVVTSGNGNGRGLSLEGSSCSRLEESMSKAMDREAMVRVLRDDQFALHRKLEVLWEFTTRLELRVQQLEGMTPSTDG